MAQQDHVRVLKQGVNAWNTWRRENPGEKPDLAGLRMKRADLSRVDLSRAQLTKADLRGSLFWSANLAEADLSGSRLVKAYFVLADLTKADFRNAKLCGADFRGADLREADLRSADLQGANLSETKLRDADLSGACVYGVSAWNLHTNNGTVQRDLVITRADEPTITVDSLEVAQFIHMLTNNKKIREVIDTVTSKVVLILGSFTAERKNLLDILHARLQGHDYVPVLFDFDKPATRNTIETVTTIARLARFIVADITEPRSVPHELATLVPALPSVPVQPLLVNGAEPWGMYDAIKAYPWVRPIWTYESARDLDNRFETEILVSIEATIGRAPTQGQRRY